MVSEKQADGWNYGSPKEGGDARKFVTLEQHGMVWVGIRAWHAQGGYWVNNGEPEIAKVTAWQDLPEPARGYWDRGKLVLPRDPLDEIASEVLNEPPGIEPDTKLGWKP